MINDSIKACNVCACKIATRKRQLQLQYTIFTLHLGQICVRDLPVNGFVFFPNWSITCKKWTETCVLGCPYTYRYGNLTSYTISSEFEQCKGVIQSTILIFPPSFSLIFFFHPAAGQMTHSQCKGKSPNKGSPIRAQLHSEKSHWAV